MDMKFEDELYSKIESLIISYTINNNETAGQLTRKILTLIKKQKMEQLEKEVKDKMLQIAKDYIERRKSKPFEDYEEAKYLNSQYLTVKEYFGIEGDFYIVLNDCIKEVLGKKR